MFSSETTLNTTEARPSPPAIFEIAGSGIVGDVQGAARPQRFASNWPSLVSIRIVRPSLAAPVRQVQPQQSGRPRPATAVAPSRRPRRQQFEIPRGNSSSTTLALTQRHRRPESRWNRSTRQSCGVLAGARRHASLLQSGRGMLRGPPARRSSAPLWPSC